MMNSQPPRPTMVSGVSQPPPLQHLQQAPQAQLPQQMLMNPVPPQQQMMNRSYGMWPPLPPAGPTAGPMDRRQFNFRKPNSIPSKAQGSGGGSGYVSGSKPLGPRNNWKGKKVGKGKEFGRRIDVSGPAGGNNLAVSFGNPNIGIGGAYIPPSLNDLQHQNRVKTKRFFNKKNFNNKNNNYNRGKFAPRNTSSYLIRAKKSGGITELVSPCPVTPAILPTPIFSPSKEVLVDMAKEEWGVDGYGSMKGLIRLRSPGHEAVDGNDGEESDEGGSSESDVEEHVEVERRLDHDLSRFEMIYPNYGTATDHNNIMESRVDDPDSYIAHLEEENLILKERLFLMERENGDLRRRLQFSERQNKGGEVVNEETDSENENDSDSHGDDVHSVDVNREEMFEEVNGADGDATAQGGSNSMQGVEAFDKEEENIERQLVDVDEEEVQVVELNEHVHDINSDDDKVQVAQSKEQISDVNDINSNKDKVQVVGLKEQITDIKYDEDEVQVGRSKGQINDINSANVTENNSSCEDKSLGTDLHMEDVGTMNNSSSGDKSLAADLSMEDVATIGKAINAENQASQEVSEESIGGGD